MTDTNALDQINAAMLDLAVELRADDGNDPDNARLDALVDDLTHTVARALGVTTGRACPMCGVDLPDNDAAVNQHYNDLHDDSAAEQGPRTPKFEGASDGEIHAQGMRRITLTWEETATYEQNFIVPADFDPEAAIQEQEEGTDDDGPLINLITEYGDFTTVHHVSERYVTNLETDNGESYPLS